MRRESDRIVGVEKVHRLTFKAITERGPANLESKSAKSRESACWRTVIADTLASGDAYRAMNSGDEFGHQIRETKLSASRFRHRDR